MAGGRSGGWRLDRREVLEDLEEEDDDDEDEDEEQSGETNGDNSGSKIVQEVKYCSKVQFRAPDIIEL
jgi:hypothetical protein